MKKILLLLIIVAGASAVQLKAQQSSNKPSDLFLLKTHPDQTFQQFKLGDSSLFKSFSVLPKVQQLAAIPYKLPDYNSLTRQIGVNIDNMLILKVSGNIDHMPIAKPSGNMERMPILKPTHLDPSKLVNP
jgi:hypothetical protein